MTRLLASVGVAELVEDVVRERNMERELGPELQQVIITFLASKITPAQIVAHTSDLSGYGSWTFFHAAERTSVMAKAIFFTEQEPQSWGTRMRRLLAKPAGVGRVRRSAAILRKRRGLRAGHKKDFESACNYLPERRQFMNYDLAQFVVDHGGIRIRCAAYCVTFGIDVRFAPGILRFFDSPTDASLPRIESHADAIGSKLARFSRAFFVSCECSQNGRRAVFYSTDTCRCQ